jgi:hypothetical protein
MIGEIGDVGYQPSTAVAATAARSGYFMIFLASCSIVVGIA